MNRNEAAVLLTLLILFIATGCGNIEKTYWPEGKIKSRVPYDRSGKIDGTAYWYYQDGMPQMEADYSGGMLDGTLTRWQENGVKVFEGQYSEGMLNGISIEWNFAGIKILQQTYTDDILNGPFADWYPSGQRLSEGQYLDGYMEGTWVWWDIAGNIMARGEFVGGNGLKKIINPMGREIGTVEYIGNVEQPSPFSIESF